MRLQIRFSLDKIVSYKYEKWSLYKSDTKEKNMKKLSKVVAIMLVLVLALSMFAGCGETALWKPGKDSVEYKTAGANDYAGTFNVFLKIVGAEENVLFDGTVKLTTNTQWVSEAIMAAVSDKGLANDGIEVGFITRIGDYTNDSNENMYWGFKVNGESPNFGCSGYQLREGDYILVQYSKIIY